MLNLLTFILACYGMTMVVVYSKLFEKPRTVINSLNNEYITYMLKCTMCMGFWVGIFNWFLLDLSFNLFIAGCISSGTSYLLSRLADDDGLTIKVKKQ